MLADCFLLRHSLAAMLRPRILTLIAPGIGKRRATIPTNTIKSKHLDTIVATITIAIKHLEGSQGDDMRNTLADRSIGVFIGTRAASLRVETHVC